MRLYEMFMGPLDVAKPWQMSGVNGVRRFLDRAWRIVCGDDDELNPAVQDAVPASTTLLRLRHQTVASVTGDIEALRFNTAIARLMEMANGLTVASVRPREVVETFVKLLAPFAPHLAEELWSKLGHEGTLAYAAWPDFDPAMTRKDAQEYVVQVNGKVRHRFEGATGLDADALLAVAKAEPVVSALLDGRVVVKEIVVPGRLVNFVVEGSRKGLKSAWVDREHQLVRVDRRRLCVKVGQFAGPMVTCPSHGSCDGTLLGSIQFPRCMGRSPPAVPSCRISRPIAGRFVPPPLASTRTIPRRVHGLPPRPSRLQRPVARRYNS